VSKTSIDSTSISLSNVHEQINRGLTFLVSAGLRVPRFIQTCDDVHSFGCITSHTLAARDNQLPPPATHLCAHTHTHAHNACIILIEAYTQYTDIDPGIPTYRLVCPLHSLLFHPPPPTKEMKVVLSLMPCARAWHKQPCVPPLSVESKRGLHSRISGVAIGLRHLACHLHSRVRVQK
jgi:hypothetical protein